MRIFKHPIKKLTLATAFGGGYVLGAKAGRERYEQIMTKFNQVKGDPRVQQATGRAEDLVRETTSKVAQDPRVQDVAAKAQTAMGHDDASTSSSESSSSESSSSDSGSQDTSASPTPPPPPAPAPTPTPTPAPPKSDASEPGVHRLLVDEHVDEPDEVVYSSGPDVVQPLVDDSRDTV